MPQGTGEQAWDGLDLQSSRAPTSASGDTATRRRRQRFEDEDVEILRHHLLDDPSNPVFDLLDRVERGSSGG